MSMLSGKIGIPEGSFRRLSNTQAESALEFIVQNQIEITQLVQAGTGGGGGLANWIRFKAAGTKMAGTGITVTRSSEGTYLCTASSAFPTSGGAFQYGVLTNPSTVSGNGGDGVSPFKAFSAATAAQTDSQGSNHNVYFYVSSVNSIYFLGSGDDVVYIHDLDDWTTTAVTIDPGADPIRTANDSGCLSREEDYIWLSAQETPFCPLRALKISTGAVTTFTTTLSHVAVGAFTDSGNVYVLIAEGATLKAYLPNFGTGALGSVVSSWSFTAAGSYAVQGEWDSSNRIWFASTDGFIQVNPLVSSTFRTHAYPTTLIGTSPAPGSRPTYDSLRNRFYVQAGGSLTNSVLTYAGWSNTTNNSGTWAIFIANVYPTCIGHDSVSDVVLVPEYAIGVLHRYFGETGQSIDSLHFPNDIAGYTFEGDDYCFYIGECAYFRVEPTVGALKYLMRVCYSGAELDFGGAGGSIVSSALISQYQIISATQAYIYLFRSLSPIIRADGECTVAFVSDADTAQSVTIQGTDTGAAIVNAIMNGAFNIWQRGTTFSSVSSTTVTADRWRYLKTGAMVHDISRSTDVPTSAQAGRVFDYSLLIDCTTVDSSLAASDYAAIVQKIEGYFWTGYAQRSLVLTFWVKATKIGTYCVGFSNSGGNRSYIGEYTVVTTDTWEFKTVTVSASPSAGTWDYVEGIGCSVYFTLASGTTFQTTAGSWVTTSQANFATSSQVNACDSTANNFRITGVQLQAGTDASEFEHLSFADDLENCMRYFEKSFQYATQPTTAAGTAGASIGVQIVGASAAQAMAIAVRWLARKRTTAPTITTYNTAAAGNEIRNVSTGTDCSATAFSGTENDLQMRFSCTTPGGSAAGQVLAIHWACDAEI